MMKEMAYGWVWFWAGLCALVEPVAGEEVALSLRGGERLVFMGDSITQAGHYVVDVDCGLLAQGYEVEVLNLGLASETASKLTERENEKHLKRFGFERPWVGERFERLLAAVKPDWLFLCYGMNDADNLPAGEEGLARFGAAVTSLREQAFDSGVKRVIVCTPPIHDSKKAEPSQRQVALSFFTKWLVSQREKGWEVVDLHHPMWERLQDGRAESPDYVLAKDGVHPQREGHWIMGREILRDLFGGELARMNSAEDLLASQGKKARRLVDQRMRMNFELWMSEIGHKRPKTPGGPGVERELSLEEAEKNVAELTEQIQQLMALAQ